MNFSEIMAKTEYLNNTNAFRVLVLISVNNSNKSIIMITGSWLYVIFQIREARGLQCQADTMTEEMKICGKPEYTNKSLPLLLHQVS